MVYANGNWSTTIKIMFQYTISKFCTIMCGINACTCVVQLRSNPDLDWYTTSIDPGCYLATLWCINCLLICCLACPGFGPRDECSKVCQVFKVILAAINIMGRLNLANIYIYVSYNILKLKIKTNFPLPDSGSGNEVTSDKDNAELLNSFSMVYLQMRTPIWFQHHFSTPLTDIEASIDKPMTN